MLSATNYIDKVLLYAAKKEEHSKPDIPAKIYPKKQGEMLSWRPSSVFLKNLLESQLQANFRNRLKKQEKIGKSIANFLKGTALSMT